MRRKPGTRRQESGRSEGRAVSFRGLSDQKPAGHGMRREPRAAVVAAGAVVAQHQELVFRIIVGVAQFVGAVGIQVRGPALEDVIDVALDAEVEASGNPYPTAAIKLLLLTGCRRGEVVDLCWDYVDFEHNCLRLPDSKTGAKIVYLNAPARALLQALPRLKNNPRVIPGIRAESASAAIDKAWPRVRQAANLADLRLHDLRHSFASVGAAGGLSLPIIGALLGHKHAATTARYAHLSADPLRAANEAVGERITAALRTGSSMAPSDDAA